MSEEAAEAKPQTYADVALQGVTVEARDALVRLDNGVTAVVTRKPSLDRAMLVLARLRWYPDPDFPGDTSVAYERLLDEMRPWIGPHGRWNGTPRQAGLLRNEAAKAGWQG